jgi:hypothetical protein
VLLASNITVRVSRIYVRRLPFDFELREGEEREGVLWMDGGDLKMDCLQSREQGRGGDRAKYVHT